MYKMQKIVNASLKMGQEVSSAERVEEEDLETTVEKQPQKVTCPHCMTTVATYRCKMILDDMSEILKYKDLVLFWDTQLRARKGTYIVIYIGCETCMTDAAKPSFTHFQGGWDDAFFVEDSYEMAK